MIFLVVSLAIALVSVPIGWAFGYWVSVRVVLYLSLTLGGIAAVLLLIGSQMQGWDWVGYGIMAFLVFVPLALGLGVGGVLAFLNRGPAPPGR